MSTQRILFAILLIAAVATVVVGLSIVLLGGFTVLVDLVCNVLMQLLT